jgi:cell division protein ZipA
MELGVRDWMIIVGVLLIFAVLLDGYRRVRNERRGKIKMSLNKQFLNAADEPDELSNSELPGEPRVVGRAVLVEESDSDEESGLQLNQDAPILMESVEADSLPKENPIETDKPDSQILFEGYEQPDVAEKTSQVDPADQEVISINVMARNGSVFKGPDLLHIPVICSSSIAMKVLMVMARCNSASLIF